MLYKFPLYCPSWSKRFPISMFYRSPEVSEWVISNSYIMCISIIFTEIKWGLLDALQDFSKNQKIINLYEYNIMFL